MPSRQRPPEARSAWRNHSDGWRVIVEALRQLPLEVHAALSLLPVAFQHAVSLGATVYDAVYVALAEQLRAPLITKDTQLLS